MPPIAAPHPSVEERTARGKAAGRKAPRGSHAAWEPPPGRRDPVDVLLEQAEDREPELVPVRHGRMLASPFVFLRGAAALMASEIAPTLLQVKEARPSALEPSVGRDPVA